MRGWAVGRYLHGPTEPYCEDLDGSIVPGKQKEALTFAGTQQGKTFTVGSSLKHENSSSEWRGARGHYEEPLSHCPCRGWAHHRWHAGGDEQGL